MKEHIFIPNEVVKSISSHLKRKVARSIDGYLSGIEDEDALTGALGENLRIENRKVKVSSPEIGGVWTWGISYHKFRGKGPKANENFVGADGIFELILERSGTPFKHSKAALFQAKNNWVGNDTTLLEQSIKLSTWREASFAVNYTSTAYEAYSIDDVIRTRGRKSEIKRGAPLADYLKDHFIACLIGDSDLSYDGRRRILRWVSMNGETVETQFSMGHRFSIKIRQPKLSKQGEAKRISNSQIHKFRMHADDNDILSLPSHCSTKDIDKARKQFALAYHPDRYSGTDSVLQEILKQQMQMANRSSEALRDRIKNR